MRNGFGSVNGIRLPLIFTPLGRFVPGEQRDCVRAALAALKLLE